MSSGLHFTPRRPFGKHLFNYCFITGYLGCSSIISTIRLTRYSRSLQSTLEDHGEGCLLLKINKLKKNTFFFYLGNNYYLGRT